MGAACKGCVPLMQSRAGGGRPQLPALRRRHPRPAHQRHATPPTCASMHACCLPTWRGVSPKLSRPSASGPTLSPSPNCSSTATSRPRAVFSRCLVRRCRSFCGTRRARRAGQGGRRTDGNRGLQACPLWGPGASRAWGAATQQAAAPHCTLFGHLESPASSSSPPSSRSPVLPDHHNPRFAPGSSVTSTRRWVGLPGACAAVLPLGPALDRPAVIWHQQSCLAIQAGSMQEPTVRLIVCMHRMQCSAAHAASGSAPPLPPPQRKQRTCFPAATLAAGLGSRRLLLALAAGPARAARRRPAA